MANFAFLLFSILFICFPATNLAVSVGAVGATMPFQPVGSFRQAPESSSSNSVDVQAMLNAVGSPISCLGRCTAPLVPHFNAVLSLKDIYNNIEPLCTAYNATTRCVNTRFCQHSQIFDLASSGIQSICLQKKSEFMRNHAVCLRAHLDQNSQVCENQCHFIGSVANYSRKPELQARQGIQQLYVMLQGLGEVCTSAQCYFPCFRDKMNAVCEKSGGVITDAMLRPFYRLAKILEGSSPAIRKMVAEKVPKSCEFLLQKSSLDAIRRKDNQQE